MDGHNSILRKTRQCSTKAYSQSLRSIAFMNKLYQYQKKLPHTPHGRGKEETQIVDAERSFVDSYISREEFAELFGGFLITEDREDPPGLYRGVWGKDKVRKFKQVLQERGAEFEICKIDGSQRIFRVTAQEKLLGDAT